MSGLESHRQKGKPMQPYYVDVMGISKRRTSVERLEYEKQVALQRTSRFEEQNTEYENLETVVKGHVWSYRVKNPRKVEPRVVADRSWIYSHRGGNAKKKLNTKPKKKKYVDPVVEATKAREEAKKRQAQEKRRKMKEFENATRKQAEQTWLNAKYVNPLPADRDELEGPEHVQVFGMETTMSEQQRIRRKKKPREFTGFGYTASTKPLKDPTGLRKEHMTREEQAFHRLKEREEQRKAYEASNPRLQVKHPKPLKRTPQKQRQPRELNLSSTRSTSNLNTSWGPTTSRNFSARDEREFVREVTTPRQPTVPWDELASLLPVSQTRPDMKARAAMFKKMDRTGDGELTVSELLKGLKKILKKGKGDDINLEFLVNAAFKKAKAAQDDNGNKFVDEEDFRLMLIYLGEYFTYQDLFLDIDKDGSGSLSMREFKLATKLLRGHGVRVSDVQATFDKIDKNGSGSISFKEFFKWAVGERFGIEAVKKERKNVDTSSKQAFAAAIAASDESKAPLRSQSAADDDNYDEFEPEPEPKKKEPAKKEVGSDDDFDFDEAPPAEAAKAKDVTKHKVHWSQLASHLPTRKTSEDKEARIKLFREMDPNESGKLSIGEVQSGMQKILHSDGADDELIQPIIKAAFARASNANGDGGKDAKYVEPNEFRRLLVYLAEYFLIKEFWEEVDKDGSGHIRLAEFKKAVPMLQKHGIEISKRDAAEQFEEIDQNEGGTITFEEFFEWAVKEAFAADLVEDERKEAIDKVAEEKKEAPPEKKKRRKKKKTKAVPKEGLYTLLNGAVKDLPTELNSVDRDKRKEMFNSFDPNGNGFLSLAEVDKGIRDVIKSDKLFDAKPAIMRAFQAAKSIDPNHKGMRNGKAVDEKKQKEIDDSYIERTEFRMLLVNLKLYFELYVLFDAIDGDDRRIEKDEFVKLAFPALEAKGIVSSDESAAKLFDKIDSNDGGYVLFEEFTKWAIHRGMDKNLEQAEQLHSDENFEYADAPVAIHWSELASHLPTRKTSEDKEARIKLFREMDPNESGKLSIGEVQSGMQKILHSDGADDELIQPIIKAAFARASNANGDGGKDAKYVEPDEFRRLLVYLAEYFLIKEFWEEVDKDGSGHIRLAEFKKAVPMLQKHGIEISKRDAAEQFEEIDQNEGGTITFEEFFEWAVKEAFAADLVKEERKDAVDAKKAEAAPKKKKRRKKKKPVSTSDNKVHWSNLAKHLPTQFGDKERAERAELFKKFDPNGSGKISLKEAQAGVSDYCKADSGEMDLNPVIEKAFKAAANANGDGGKDGNYVEPDEFRLLLVYLSEYFLIQDFFMTADADGSGHIKLAEFRKAVPLLIEEGIKVDDAVAMFEKLDKNGGGTLTFDEFFNWAVKEKFAVEMAQDERSMGRIIDQSKKLDWQMLSSFLPTDKTEEDQKLRLKLFKKFSTRGKHNLTLKEVQTGIAKLLDVHAKGMDFGVIIKEAFETTKKAHANDKKHAEVVLESEFRLLLIYLAEYFQYMKWFVQFDRDGDMEITIDEFKQAVPTLEERGIKVPDPVKTFAEIDTDNDKEISFKEFFDWAVGIHVGLIIVAKAHKAVKRRSVQLDRAPKLNDTPVMAKDIDTKNIHWSELAAHLPTRKTSEDKEARIKLFREMDPNESGKLSIGEVQSGMQKILHSDGADDQWIQPIIQSAFSRASNANGEGGRDGKYVEPDEFRLLLVYLAEYFLIKEFWHEVDKDGSGHIRLSEFKRAVPMLQEHGIEISKRDASEQFSEMDKNGGGTVTFSEFFEWAVKEAFASDLVEDERKDAVEAKKEEAVPKKKKRRKKKPKANAAKEGAYALLTGAVKELPTELNATDRDKRRKMFNSFDPNGNGFLSLAEVDKGIRDVIKSDKLFDAKPAIMRAFQAAKSIDPNHKGMRNGKAVDEKKQKEIDDSYIERTEFRMLLVNLKLYFELYVLFDSIDGDDRRIEKEEFTKLAYPKLQEMKIIKLGESGPMIFDEIDTNHGGYILFQEFTKWVLSRGMKTNLEEADQLQGDENFEYVEPFEPVHWSELASHLPTRKTKDDKEARIKLFGEMDPNNSGKLSIGEVQAGMQKILHSDGADDELIKPIIKAAFARASNSNGDGGKDGKYVEPNEFRLLLVYLAEYFLIKWFWEEVDTDGSGHIRLPEFKKAVPMLQDHGIEISKRDAAAQFKEIDQNDGGTITFEEFFEWAVKEAFTADLVKEERKDQVDAQQEAEAPKEEEVLAKNSVHWSELASHLPTRKTKDDKEARIKLFGEMDPNNSGKLSIGEVQAGMQKILHSDGADDELIKPIIKAAFARASNANGDGGKDGKYVEPNEFRLLLVYLAEYFLIKWFWEEVDTDGSGHIRLPEFKKAVPMLQDHGIEISKRDAAAQFKEIDQNDGGTITFEEFFEWAVKEAFTADLVKEERKDQVDAQQEPEAPKEEEVLAKNSVHWSELASHLPTRKTSEDKEARIKLFGEMDPNNSGKLSIGEVQAGMQKILHSDGADDELIKPIIKAAFARASNANGDGGKDGKYVEPNEFRLLLVYLAEYFLIKWFWEEVDTDGSGHIRLPEFKKAVPMLQDHGIEISTRDAAAQFKEIDQNDGGTITFEEFFEWAVKEAFTADLVKEERKDQVETQNVMDLDADDDGYGDSFEDDYRGSPEKPRMPTKPSALNALAKKIPFEKTGEHEDKRIRAFEEFDSAENGSLTKEDITVGLEIVLDVKFELKDIVESSVALVKHVMGELDIPSHAENIEMNEFRYILMCVNAKLRYAALTTDMAADAKLSKDEFVECMSSLVPKSAVDPDDLGDEFSILKAMNRGSVSKTKALDWALQKMVEQEVDSDRGNIGESYDDDFE